VLQYLRKDKAKISRINLTGFFGSYLSEKLKTPENLEPQILLGDKSPS